MLGLRHFGTVAAVLLLCGSVQAQTAQPQVPPENDMKLSEIIARIEQRDQEHHAAEYGERGHQEPHPEISPECHRYTQRHASVSLRAPRSAPCAQDAR